jgi:hypothetical protein
MMQPERRVDALVDVRSCPQLPEMFARQGQFTDQLDETRIVGVAAYQLPESGEEPRRGRLPVDVERLLGGVEEYAEQPVLAHAKPG